MLAFRFVSYNTATCLANETGGLPAAMVAEGVALGKPARRRGAADFSPKTELSIWRRGTTNDNTEGDDST